MKLSDLKANLEKSEQLTRNMVHTHCYILIGAHRDKYAEKVITSCTIISNRTLG